MEAIVVNVDVDGKVKVEAQGVTGQGCAALTKAIEQSLGRTVSDQKKGEYFAQQVQHARAGQANPGQR